MTQRVLSRPARIASIAARDLAEARRLVAEVPERADAIELRLDLFQERVFPRELLHLDPRPIVATYRTRSEGGAFDGRAEEYARATEEVYASGLTVDVEHSSGLLERGGFPERDRVVVSCHAPFGLPADWTERLSAMRAAGARAVKLVAGAADLSSSLEIARLQRIQTDPSVSIFPMGPASAPGRILAAIFGGSLVYGSVGSATAAGQPPLAELLDSYGVDRIARPDQLFGIVGRDVSGSLSPLLHNALFARRGLSYLYLPLPVSDFERSRPQELDFDPPFRAFSITRPWKRHAAQTAVPSEDVRATGAANTLAFERGRWLAWNTDVDGIFDPLADHDTGEGRSAVILGAGGVARAAVVAARKLGYEVMVAARRDAAADALAEDFSVDSLAWDDLGATEADLYVNATPVGSAAEDPPILPTPVLGHRPLVLDCVYRRDGSPTATLAAARAARCPTIDGLRVFAAQAVRQARIFGVEDASLEEVEQILTTAPRRSP